MGQGSREAVGSGGAKEIKEAEMSKASQTYDELTDGDAARSKGLVDGGGRKGGKRDGSGGRNESRDNIRERTLSGGHPDLRSGPRSGDFSPTPREVGTQTDGRGVAFE